MQKIKLEELKDITISNTTERFDDGEEKIKKQEQRRQDAWNRQHMILDGIDHKICSRCKKWFPATTEHFYKNKLNGIDGLFPYCKKCNIESTKSWVRDNYKRKQESNTYHNANPSEKTRRARRENSRNRRKNGKHKEWIKNNPDRLKLYNQQHNMHDITKEEWESCLRYFNYKCAYCGLSQNDAKEKYNNYLHKEHVRHDGANDLSNCIPACKKCNSRKWQHGMEAWYNKENIIFDIKRYTQIIQWLKYDYMHYIIK